MTPPAPEAVQAAARAFIYGYPLVYGLREVAGFATGHSTLPVSAPWNTFGYARELLGPETTFVTPNNDTLYTLAALDLSAGPQLIGVPDTGERYYVLQCVDAWTNNFAYIGTRASGNREGRFCFAGPGYDGAVPDGATLVRSPTDVCMIVGRVQVDGVDDLPAVHALQDRFTIEPVGTPAGPPRGVPAGDPAAREDLAWWETFRVQLAAFPPPAADAELLEALRPLGVLEPATPYADPDPGLAATLVAAQQAAEAKIEELGKGGAPGPNGWVSAKHIFDYNLDHLGPGTIDSPQWKIADRAVAYATRAAAARAGLFGNHGYEADYELIFTDAGGEQLSGEHRYELRLETPPPVDAFWSLTMYSVPDYLLVANPIGRYSIGDRTPGLRHGEDGSLTLLLQHEPPAEDEQANWLPAPSGAFRPVLRMYAPGAAVLDGTYALPPIRRIG
jgi:hypothetical protein